MQTAEGVLEETARRARADIEFFARVLTGRPLWPHQAEFARSSARYRVVAAGRQVGKSALLSVEALHAAFRRPNQLVLVVSAGEVASRRLLADIAALASASPMLADSVVDDSVSVVTLANGSEIRSVPASQRQIRGWAVDLLILDEAGFIDPGIWRAAEPAIIARPGSRVILSSSPYGAVSHFFRQLWMRGMDAPDEQLASWHWPSTMSPLVDGALLEQIRSREAPMYFAREFLAEWTDDAGAYFAVEEIERATVDYELIDPAAAGGQLVAAGVDWGLSHDANTLVLLGVLADDDLAEGAQPRRPVFFVAHLEEHFRMPYDRFIDRVVDVGRGPHGFEVCVLASETNGVGQFPTTELIVRTDGVWPRRAVAPVHTDARRKESAFGAIKLLLQQGRLLLPRHPGLLRQLEALQFEQTDSGGLRIAVPDRLGHDDLVMALAQAVSCLAVDWERPPGGFGRAGSGEVLESGSGTRIHRRPRCAYERHAFGAPLGRERSDGW